MLGTRMSREEMLKDTRRLIKNISRRVSRIEALGDQASQSAVNKYKQVMQGQPRYISALGDKELRELYKDLVYVNNLKSTTVKGAININKNIEPIFGKISKMGTRRRHNIERIYNRLVEEADIFRFYKYEILEYLATRKGYIKIEETVRQIHQMYQETVEELGNYGSGQEYKTLFKSKLDSII